MTSAPGSPARRPALDGLRGAAATLVFLVHYASLSHPWAGEGASAQVLSRLGTLGNGGVDLFFALSGYLIYGGLIRRPQRLLPYLRRRAMRLYPAFLLVLAAYLLAGAVLPGASRVPPGWLGGGAYLLANVALLPGVLPITPIITVAWSLSWEAAFYLLLPALIGVLRLRAWPAPARAGLILLAPLLAQWMGEPYPRAGMFACGMVLAEAVPLLSRRGPRLGLLASAAMPACAALFLGGGNVPAAFWAGFVATFAVCGAAAAGTGGVARLLSWHPLAWLGTVSYSFYLLHGALLHAVFAAVRGAGAEGALAWPLLPPAFAVCCLGAAALYRLAERPFLPPTRGAAVTPGARPAASPPCSPSPSR